MTPMDVFDKNGLYAGRQTVQIALSHAYGEGMEESCENTVKAVSELFLWSADTWLLRFEYVGGGRYKRCGRRRRRGDT